MGGDLHLPGLGDCVSGLAEVLREEATHNLGLALQTNIQVQLQAVLEGCHPSSYLSIIWFCCEARSEDFEIMTLYCFFYQLYERRT